VLENDANGQALAEYRFGAGRGSSPLAYLNLGTGIGGGIVLDGRLYGGAHGLAGEFGHMIIRPGGPRCTCGRHGCLEALCSGPAMGRRAREALAALHPQERAATALVQRAGSRAAVSGPDLTALAAEGDALSLQVLDGVFTDLAIAIANIAASLDPALVVIGGGAAGWAPPLFDRLHAQVRRHCLPGTQELVRLAPAALGADAGILGGAAVFLER
jgi:glucokinase